jgi:hypothetical protein
MSQPDLPPPLALEGEPHDAATEQIIALLEERLVVNLHRRKIGEVVVRKEIETHIIEVPVRRERLIVEQISPQYERLAVVDLGSTMAEESNSLTTNANFTSVNVAIDFLQSIASHPNTDLTPIPIDIVLAHEHLQAAYQKWLTQSKKTTL